MQWDYLLVGLTEEKGQPVVYLNEEPIQTKPVPTLPKLLKQLGKQGWELVSTEKDDAGLAMFFKKPIIKS